MAKGDTAPPRRSSFDDTDTTPVDTGPRRLRYPCRARGCPMPGTIFPGGADDGICAWHFGCNSDELPKITTALADWEGVARAVNQCRTETNDPGKAGNPRAQNEAQAEIWALLLPSVLGSGWKPRLAPVKGEYLGDWGRRLERFLRDRIKERLSGSVIADDDKPTPTVADMLSRVRGSLPGRAWGDQ